MKKLRDLIIELAPNKYGGDQYERIDGVKGIINVFSKMVLYRTLKEDHGIVLWAMDGSVMLSLDRVKDYPITTVFVKAGPQYAKAMKYLKTNDFLR